MTDRDVWGFTISTSPSGKNLWPAALKKEAVRRIQEEGASLGDIADEIGAHECLVRKWHVAERRARGEPIQSRSSAFAELVVSDVALPAGVPAPSAERGCIRVGAIAIEFPITISEADLVRLLRAAGTFA